MLEHIGVSSPLSVASFGGSEPLKYDFQFDVQPVFLFRHLPGDFCHVLFRAVDDADFDMVWSVLIAA